MALRNLRRAVEYANDTIGLPAVAEALMRFDEAAPARTIRNMLEHFDKYVRNEGDLQKKGKVVGFDLQFGSTSADTAFVQVQPFRFNTDDAMGAAEAIANSVLTELETLRTAFG